MLCVVAPVLHKFPVAAEEVRITLPPEQNVIGPLADMVGMGLGLTVTTVAADVPPQVPSVVTV